MTNQPFKPGRPTTKALNQLLSVLVGRDIAIATNDLADDPWARIHAAMDRVSDEISEALATGNAKAMLQVQRKNQSLSSLQTLAYRLRECMDPDLFEEAETEEIRQQEALEEIKRRLKS
jgi:hypothetical protein